MHTHTHIYNKPDTYVRKCSIVYKGLCGYCEEVLCIMMSWSTYEVMFPYVDMNIVCYDAKIRIVESAQGNDWNLIIIH